MAPPKKFKRVVALDGHRLGLVSGAVLALVVMASSFFYQHIEFLAAGVRTGWAFVAGYTATFFLVRVILRTTLVEFLDYKEVKTRSRFRRADSDEEDEATADLPEAMTPEDLLAQQVGGLASVSDTEAPGETEVQPLGG